MNEGVTRSTSVSLKIFIFADTLPAVGQTVRSPVVRGLVTEGRRHLVVEVAGAFAFLTWAGNHRRKTSHTQDKLACVFNLY